jgi:hypothetical protein
MPCIVRLVAIVLGFVILVSSFEPCVGLLSEEPEKVSFCDFGRIFSHARPILYCCPLPNSI